MTKLIGVLLAALCASAAFAHDAVLSPLRPGARMLLGDRDVSYGRWHRGDGLHRTTRDYSLASRDRGHSCPPGLARKHDGCLPPGLARRFDRDNRRWDSDERFVRSLVDRRDGDERVASR